MTIWRVIDFSAKALGESKEGVVKIDGEPYRRRLMKADAIISLIQETSTVGTSRFVRDDRWHWEGDPSEADQSWTMVCIRAGDRLCSASSDYNTGNARNLVERVAIPLYGVRSLPRQFDSELMIALGERHERCTLPSGHPSNWLHATLVDLARDVERLLAAGVDASRGRKLPLPECDRGNYVYLVAEDGDAFVKVGKCKNERAPAGRRAMMYQPGNRRPLHVIAQWQLIGGTNPESAMKRRCDAAAKRRNTRSRAEWFELDPGSAVETIEEMFSDSNHGKYEVNRVT